MNAQKDLELLNEMRKMQSHLDSEVMNKKGLSGYEDIPADALGLAILDEVGELNHEMKSRWCWWKDSQKLEDPLKVVEEFIDVIHFVLMATNKWPERFADLEYGYIEGQTTETPSLYFTLKSLIPVYSRYAEEFQLDGLGYGIAQMMKILGIDMEFVYQTYVKKNRVNLERAEGDY